MTPHYNQHNCIPKEPSMDVSCKADTRCQVLSEKGTLALSKDLFYTVSLKWHAAAFTSHPTHASSPGI